MLLAINLAFSEWFWVNLVFLACLCEGESALIRLADALCGLIGMALDGNEECKILVEQGIKRGTLCEL
jgi:hypothetical protein